MKASTILETIIAMLILMIIFIVSGMTIVNISKSGLSEQKVISSNILSEYMDVLNVKKNDNDFSEEFKGYRIDTSIEPYFSSLSLRKVTCKLLDHQGKFVIEIIQLKTVQNQ